MRILLDKKSNIHNCKDFVVEVKENGCWESVSHKAADGWGYTIITRNGKADKAHRYFYKKLVGEIPDGLFVLHKCDNPKCCNPAHLFLGTNQDNMADKVNKGRQPSHIGTNNPKCKLSEENVIKIFYDNRVQDLVASEYGISSSTVRDIKKFRSWTNVTNVLRGDV